MLITPNKIHPMYEKYKDEADKTIISNVKEKEDVVNHPKHYTNNPSGIEVIQITEHMNFCRGNAIKYIMRAGIKDPSKEIEDLQKAAWYINREIERLKNK